MFDALGWGFEPKRLIIAPTAIDSLESLLAAPAYAVDDVIQLYDRFWTAHCETYPPPSTAQPGLLGQ